MSPAPIETSNSQDSGIVRRRRFISTALLGGVAVALAPDIRVAAAPSAQVETLAAKDVLPTAADCLSLYLPILERIKQDILHSYYTRVGCLAGEVRNRYLELQKHVKEFERLVPQLQADRKTSEIKNATQWGETSAAGIKQMAEGGVIFMDAHLALMSYSSERLNEGIAEWQKQRGSLTLSPEAVKLLRTILQEVRDLDQSTDSLDKTSKVLTNIDETLGGEVSKIKANIQLAISKLVTSELSKQESSAAEWDEAKQFVQTAIGQLQALDAFVPPQTFKDLVNQNSFKAAQCLTAPAQSDSDPSAPTKNLRTLLEGAVQWIDGGFQLSRGDDTPHGGATFIKASMNASMAPVWLQTFFTVRQILQSILPDGSNGRAWGCLGLITVPHVAERDVAKRAMLIYGLLPNLSAGRVAMTDERRRLLAQRLAELSI